MSDFKSRWKAALGEKKKSTHDFPTFQDGTYVMQLVGAERGESKRGRHQIAMEFVIKDGPADRGESYRAYLGLDTEQAMLYTMRDLERLGVDVSSVEEMEELDAALIELVSKKPTVSVQLVTRGEYQNMRRVKRVTADFEVETTPRSSGDEEPEDSVVE